MASGIFAILDDIAALMDDVAVTSKIATQKTAGILGDDLAVNAEKATGFVSSRELPVLWAITKGSFVNKLIIIPIVFVLNALFPPAINYILILGGVYLAYEGVEKVIHYITHRKEENTEHDATPTENTPTNEKAKVKAAITTDFILSIEIVIIALGTVLEKQHPLATQIIVVTFVSFLATVGVYGIVALIVRMDDAGRKLMEKAHGKGIINSLGNSLVKLLPVVIKALGYIGTVALLLVSGGIFEHRIPFLHHVLPTFPAIARQLIFAIVAGLIAFPIVWVLQKIFAVFKKKKTA